MAPLRAVEKPPCGILRTPRPGGGVQATAAAGMLLSRARQRRGRGRERATRPRRCLGVGPGATMGKIISVASKLRRDRARRLRTRPDRDRGPPVGGLARRPPRWLEVAPAGERGPLHRGLPLSRSRPRGELDGGIHADQVEYDARRGAYLRRQGLQVLWFWNAEVVDDLDRVVSTIVRACRQSDPRRRGSRIERGRRTTGRWCDRVPRWSVPNAAPPSPGLPRRSAPGRGAPNVRNGSRLRSSEFRPETGRRPIVP